MSNFLGHPTLGASFYGVVTPDFTERLRQFLATTTRIGVFAGDNLITWSKGLSFLEDRRLVEAFDRHSESVEECSLIWRTAILAWAAKRGLRRAGDFMECGAYRGTTARILCDYLDFGRLDRRYYLYDMFDWGGESYAETMPLHGPDLYEQVRQRFADLPNVTIVKGRLPDSLAIAAPERIALLHVDLNSVEAERGVLERLYPRVADGGAIVLDDYGWDYYAAQRQSANQFFAAQGTEVLELPTGQGLVIK